jgi:hypothetical protein
MANLTVAVTHGEWEELPHLDPLWAIRSLLQVDK